MSIVEIENSEEVVAIASRPASLLKLRHELPFADNAKITSLSSSHLLFRYFHAFINTPDCLSNSVFILTEHGTIKETLLFCMEFAFQARICLDKLILLKLSSQSTLG